MTDQDAFDEWLAKRDVWPRITYDEVWRAALAWLRSQGEPVGYAKHIVTDNGVVLGWLFREEYRDGYRPVFLAPQPAIPDGWKLVPQEPTRAMYKAAMKESDDKWIAEPKLYVAYRAMIAAAPEYNQGEVK